MDIADLSCELLSFFVPLGEFTATHDSKNEWKRLWIAFVLCTFGWIYSPEPDGRRNLSVVNCFRSLYLWVNLQLKSKISKTFQSCELLSFFVPLGEFTAVMEEIAMLIELWIAFVLCTFGWIYSWSDNHAPYERVVNCFRSLYLWVNLQPTMRIIWVTLSCELLSFFVPLGEFTAHWHQVSANQHVVNCFRSLYLWVNLQPPDTIPLPRTCCELLSFFVPLGEFTAVNGW